MSCYVDTSALAKWYVPEVGSEEFEDFAGDAASLVISRLVTVELRCLLARRRRYGQIDRQTANDAYRLFLDDIGQGHIVVTPISDARFGEALAIIDRVDAVPLRTLDAIHLAAAEAANCTTIATSDRVLHDAARCIGLEVILFGIQ